MPVRFCPTCQNPTPRTLDAPRLLAAVNYYVNYYRCDLCGAVWNVDKNDPHGPICIVTNGLPPKSADQ